jgi:polyisoprenoid-binding protein YceI
MQEHFNEKYVESDIYPKAIFKGQIQDFETIELSTTPLDVAVVGTLTIHGESHEITSVGQMYYDENNRIRVNSTIEVALDKYKIKIPSSVQENISNTIAITIQMEYEKLD